MKTLADAFEHTLQDVYYAENAIAKALPKVIDAVSNADLKTALKDHLSETKGQIKTLQAVFKSIGKKGLRREVRCDRRPDQGDRGRHRRSQRLGRQARRDHRLLPGRRALRNLEVRHVARMGQGAWQDRSARTAVRDPGSGKSGQPQAHPHRHHRDQQNHQVMRSIATRRYAAGQAMTLRGCREAKCEARSVPNF